MAGVIVEEFEVSIARACCLMDIHRSYYYYREKRDDTEVEEAIRSASEHGDGFWKIFERLRREGRTWNHKKVYRVYKKMHYERRSKLKKRLPARVKNPLEQPNEPNTTWSIDFVSDMLECGRKFRVLNVIDDNDRVAVAQEVSMSFPSQRVIRTLEKVIWQNGKPNNIRCDNGPEFISRDFQEWCHGNDIQILFTQPGKPTQNSYIERFNGSYRRAVLDAYIFRTIDEVRRKTGEWNVYYNYERPHESLGNMTPMEYSKRSAVNDPDVADRLCEGGPCHPFRQGYTSVLRTALTERPPESLFGIAAQQRPKKQRKFTREVETQT